jgi:hypothetical protein
VRLPGADRAFVDAAKVRDYLLSSSHPVGRFKAVFFAALGYRAGEWRRLAADLVRLASDGEVVRATSSAFGQKYEVRGSLRGPSGREAMVVSVWIIPDGQDVPRFVTAFPATAS